MVVVVRNTVVDVVKNVRCTWRMVWGVLGKGKLSSRGEKDGALLGSDIVGFGLKIRSLNSLME
jgi:hypothetical protein